MSGRRCAWMVLMLGMIPAIGPLFAQQVEIIDQEYKIKAAYLRNFGLYTQWPGDLGNAKVFKIGLLGKDPFGGNLEILAKDYKVKGKDIVIERFNAVNAIKPCHVLFVCGDQAKNLAQVLKQTQGEPVMVVGDAEEQAASGAAVGFFVDMNKVKFAINPEVAKAAGLKVNSDLLGAAAKIVKTKPPG